jgi:hypothetical protein
MLFRFSKRFCIVNLLAVLFEIICIFFNSQWNRWERLRL